MERDYLGLNSKNSVELVEEKIKNGCKDTVFMRGGSGMQWPFSNKVPMLPQFLPFQAVQEERSKKIVFDPLASSGFSPISTADAFETNHRTFTGVVQKNLTPNRQGSMHYSMPAYPVQHVDAHSAYRPHDIRMLSVSNNTISVAMNNPFFKTHVATSGHNTFMKQQSVGGIPITAPHLIVPCPGSMAGIADQINVSKPTVPHAQLTIFYGGSVNVYDDVSPEKAQAIMLLAANGSSENPNTTTPRAQMQAPTPKPVKGDGVHGNQSHSTSPCSDISSPMSVTSRAASQSGSGHSGTEEVIAVKPIGALTAPRSQPEPPKSVTTLVSSAASLMSTAVPQARKASLARFLEKRKERVNNTMPYNISKKSPDGCTIPGSNTASFCGDTVAGSVPTSKEHSWCLGPTKNASNNENLQTTLEITGRISKRKRRHGGFPKQVDSYGDACLVASLLSSNLVCL